MRNSSRLYGYGNSPERRLATRLLAEYESDTETLLDKLAPDTYEAAVKIACLPERIHVRDAHAATVARERAELLSSLSLQPARVGHAA